MRLVAGAGRMAAARPVSLRGSRLRREPGPTLSLLAPPNFSNRADPSIQLALCPFALYPFGNSRPIALS